MFAGSREALSKAGLAPSLPSQGCVDSMDRLALWLAEYPKSRTKVGLLVYVQTYGKDFPSLDPWCDLTKRILSFLCVISSHTTLSGQVSSFSNTRQPWVPNDKGL